MRYVSTRGQASTVGFGEVLLSGLATDGGLYMPSHWPSVALRLDALSYSETAAEVISPFVGGEIEDSILEKLIRDAYESFDHPEVAPLVPLAEDLWMLELFHGPTFAFKDIALQLVGRLMDHVLKARSEKITIVCATSGDTGSAAIEACRGREALEIFVLYPHMRGSDIQRRQMTTVDEPNVHVLAIDGTFDDCQDLVKKMFSNADLNDRVRLGAMNSINWARIASQIVYYYVASQRLHSSEPPSFSVPTGNFGNVFSGWCARKMGLPVAQLIVGSNVNDVSARFIESGELRTEPVRQTLSPSMDIQVSSNLERLIYEAFEGNGAAVVEWQSRLQAAGTVSIDTQTHEALARTWSAHRVDDHQILATMKTIYEESGTLVDPHTAIGIAAADPHREEDSPLVVLGTAHPAKFPEAVASAVGVNIPLPDRLAELVDKDEKDVVLPNSFAAVRDYVVANATSF